MRSGPLIRLALGSSPPQEPPPLPTFFKTPAFLSPLNSSEALSCSRVLLLCPLGCFLHLFLPPSQAPKWHCLDPSPSHLQIQNNWSYGENIDEDLKTHPMLRPYKTFSEKVTKPWGGPK